MMMRMGAYIQISAKSYLDFLSDNYLNTPILIIILGAVIFVIAFFGCMGAWKESSCMIYTYAVFLAIILIAELGAGIAAFALKGDLKNVIEDKMTEGINNYTDWTANLGQGNAPDSCCKDDTKGCGTGYELSKINTKGCLVEFEDQFVGNLGVVGGIAIGVAFVQFLTVVFACCLGRSIRKEGMYV